MRTLVLALFLAAILAFFAPAPRRRIRSLFARNPKIVWLFPFLLTAAFAASETLAGAFSWPLTGRTPLYALAPVAAVALPSGRGRPSARDAALERPQPGESPPGVFPPDQASCRWQRHESESVPDRGRKRLLHKALAVLLLWLPLQFAAGGSLVPAACAGLSAQRCVRDSHSSGARPVRRLPSAGGNEIPPPVPPPGFLAALGRVRAARAGARHPGSSDRFHPGPAPAYEIVRLHGGCDGGHLRRYGASGRDPVPLAHPEPHNAALRQKRRLAFRGQSHFRLRAPEQRAAGAAQLALPDPGDHRRPGLRPRVSEVFERAPRPRSTCSWTGPGISSFEREKT